MEKRSKESNIWCRNCDKMTKQIWLGSKPNYDMTGDTINIYRCTECRTEYHYDPIDR